VSKAIPVRETVEKRGRRAELSYRLVLCPNEDGKLSVEHRDTRFVSLNGMPADDPSMAPTLRKLEPVMSAIPHLIISADGQYEGVRGWGQVLEQVGALLPEEGQAELQRLRENPRARALVELAVGRRWQTWVGTWLAFDPSRGFLEREVTLVPMGEPVPLRVEMDAKPGDEQGWWRLRATTRAGGRKAKAMMADALQAMGGKDVKPEGLEIEIVSIREAETRWPVLRPRWAHSRKEIYLSHGGRRRERVEDHRYDLDWDNVTPAECPAGGAGG